MIIKNFNQLATTSLKTQALHIAEAGLHAIQTANLTDAGFLYDELTDSLTIKGHHFSLKPFKNVFVVGGGKVVAPAATIIEQKMGERITDGLIIDIVPAQLKRIKSAVGTHPLPSQANVSATKEIIDLVSNATENDLVIALIGGGGSSLLCAPSLVTLDEERLITQALMDTGTEIIEMNTVRKHLSLIKGGGLAKFAYPATVISLIFSDVPGDDISEVASGPTVQDTTTVEDAELILQKHDILMKCSLHSCGLDETEKDSKYFKNVHNILFCSSLDSLRAMRDKATELGLNVRVWDTEFGGEASEIGKKIVTEIDSGECIIATGESVVTLQPGDHGSGGRNQEMALSAAEVIGPDCVFAAVASDGRDNSDVAGAIVDDTTREAIQKLGGNLTDSLKRHDEYSVLLDAEASIITGITGSNVSDFFICIKK